jgi:superfamily II DNA or RNA helicase
MIKRLSNLLQPDFSYEQRTKGLEAYTRGAVHLQRGTNAEVLAEVQGSSSRAVLLAWHEDELEYTCSCPLAQSGQPCRHLWAAILLAEARGYLLLAVRQQTFDRVLCCTPDPASGLAEPKPVPAAPEPSGMRPLHHPKPQPAAPPPPPARPAEWQRRMAAIEQERRTSGAVRTEVWPERRQLLYLVNTRPHNDSISVLFELFTREHKVKGEGWNQRKEFRWQRRDIRILPEADRQPIALIAGGQASYGAYYAGYDQLGGHYFVPYPLSLEAVPLVCATGHCFIAAADGAFDEEHPLTWDDGEPWTFGLEMAGARGGRWTVSGVLRRGTESLDVRAPHLVAGGLVFSDDRVARLDPNAPTEWIRQLRIDGPLTASNSERDQMLAAMLEQPAAPPLTVPEEVAFEERAPQPRPRLRFRQSTISGASGQLFADLAFDYEGRQVAAEIAQSGFFDAAGRSFLRRNTECEAAAAKRLLELGLKHERYYTEAQQVWVLGANKLPAAVRALTAEGWHVEAEGRIFRSGGAPRISVSSGIDWFEMQAEIVYGDAVAHMPEILKALRKGDQMVRLDDGTYGIIPEEWLERFSTIAGLGNNATGGEHVRFRRSQAGLLDALLAAQPEVTFDEGFDRVRDQLQSFNGITAAPQPAGFAGQLRDYQRDGLGWMQFLRQFGFGGCLADDMGVGKTAQVLALFERRRELRAAGDTSSEAAAGPSLVVVPKSLVFNWKQEALRFAPQLTVLDHTGTARNAAVMGEYDVVLTTYGTLRRDAPLLQDLEFDYVVLDEAQAVKNPSSESSKAVRLLRAKHRLALSGTPVENHLGELWSLFEFLNPGMFGSSAVFRAADGALRNPDEGTRTMLAQALRPFILRRTKEQVARELPPKSEQVIFCEMEPEQKREYEELRDHVRQTLFHRVEKDGLARSKMHVLEALLRLRQAACHPGLLDIKRSGDSSAKLEFLLMRLEEVLDEGHKALVFSQFTSLLKIVRDRLDARGVVYEYLDGRTRDRQARVERFQNDPACPLFLISLKAGGLGLNLTAAEYVFILDPWWNPAVESQAIDRSHRIGQQKHVFAYRLIARGTVEEKVLELQQTKRDLAAAIIGTDNALIRDLKPEDLELLLA